MLLYVLLLLLVLRLYYVEQNYYCLINPVVVGLVQKFSSFLQKSYRVPDRSRAQKPNLRRTATRCCPSRPCTFLNCQVNILDLLQRIFFFIGFFPFKTKYAGRQQKFHKHGLQLKVVRQ